MSEIVILSGSPSKHSRSEKILKYLGNLLEQRQFTVLHLSVRDVSSADLFEAIFDSPDINYIASSIKKAKGVIIGSPVYKSAYSGVLKSLIDLLPQDALKHTPVFPVMTGGSPAHLLAMEYTLKPLISSLKGQSLKGVYFLDSQIDRENKTPIIDEELLHRMEKQLDYLIERINAQRSLYTANL